LDDALRDGQAEAAATLLARAGAVGAVESLEDVRQVLRGDANAGIADRYDRLALLDAERQGDSFLVPASADKPPAPIISSHR
jgi:hypothetical protein